MSHNEPHLQEGAAGALAGAPAGAAGAWGDGSGPVRPGVCNDCNDSITFVTTLHGFTMFYYV